MSLRMFVSSVQTEFAEERRRVYLFDMDGVLVGNCRYHVLSWLEFAKRHGGKLTEAQVIEWMGAPGRDYIVRMFADYDF